MSLDRVQVLEKAQKFVDRKAYDKALVEYRKLVAADPKDARTLLRTAELELKTGGFAEACVTYEALAKLYTRQGFVPKAIAVYRQIREVVTRSAPELDVRYDYVVIEIGELHQRLGHVNEARAAFDEAARRLVHQCRDSEAIVVLRRIVSLEPRATMSRIRLAEALFRTRDLDSALAELDTAARALMNEGQIDEALKVLERFLYHRLDLEHARKAAELYLARGKEGDAMRAIERLRPCFVSTPRDIDVLTLLSRGLFAAGQTQKALDTEKEIARAARDTGRATLFRETVRRLVAEAPNDETVRALAQQANVQLPAPPRRQPPPLPAQRRSTLPPTPRAPSIHDGSAPLTSAMWSCPPPVLDPVSPSIGQLETRAVTTSDVYPTADSEAVTVRVPTNPAPESLRQLRVSDVAPTMVRPVRLLKRNGA